MDNYKIQIEGSSGVIGIFDVKPSLKGGAFKALEDQRLFESSAVRPLRHCLA